MGHLGEIAVTFFVTLPFTQVIVLFLIIGATAVCGAGSALAEGFELGDGTAATAFAS